MVFIFKLRIALNYNLIIIENSNLHRASTAFKAQGLARQGVKAVEDIGNWKLERFGSDCCLCSGNHKTYDYDISLVIHIIEKEEDFRDSTFERDSVIRPLK
jgi:hypothetical protein